MSLITRLAGLRPSARTDGISPFSLSFQAASNEAEFLRLTLQASIPYIHVALIVGAILVAGYGVMDIYIQDDPSSLAYAALIRYFVLLPPPLILLTASYLDSYLKLSKPLGMFAICATGIGWFLFSYRTKTVVIIDNFTSVIMTTAYSFFFVGLLFRSAFQAATFINVLYCVAIWSCPH